MAKILLGFMGAGKSTIARALSADFLDMDELIVQKIGMSIQEYFAQYGEPAFRKIEAEVLAECIQQDVVLSTGGGVVSSPQNRDLLAQNPQNIYLKADFETLFRRIEGDQENQRPLYLTKSKADLQEIFEQRQALYEAVATQTIDVVGKRHKKLLRKFNESSFFRTQGIFFPPCCPRSLSPSRLSALSKYHRSDEGL